MKAPLDLPATQIYQRDARGSCGSLGGEGGGEGDGARGGRGNGGGEIQREKLEALIGRKRAQKSALDKERAGGGGGGGKEEGGGGREETKGGDRGEGGGGEESPRGQIGGGGGDGGGHRGERKSFRPLSIGSSPLTMSSLFEPPAPCQMSLTGMCVCLRVCVSASYGVATISRLLVITGLFGRT